MELVQNEAGSIRTTEVRPLSTIANLRSGVYERAQSAAKPPLFVKPVLQKVRMEGPRLDAPASQTPTIAKLIALREAFEESYQDSHTDLGEQSPCLEFLRLVRLWRQTAHAWHIRRVLIPGPLQS